MKNATTIAEAMDYLTPDNRLILGGFIERTGVPITATISDVMSEFAKDPKSSNTDELNVLCALTSVNRHKFAPKMTHDQRCEVLALHQMGIARDVLAKAYNVDRRTITHIYTERSPHYKNVRDECNGLGREIFRRKYLTDDIKSRVLLFKTETNENNKYAKSKQGLHIIRGDMCKYDHRVKIRWLEIGEEEADIAGWYYCDMDSDYPDKWFRADHGDSMRTSQTCYNAMKKEIADRMGT